MTDVIDIATARRHNDEALLSGADAHVAAVADYLGEDDGLAADNGASLLAALPERERRAIMHAAFVTRETERSPTRELLASIADYHRADCRVVLLAHGWRPPPGHVLTEHERTAARLSQQIAYAIGLEVECGEDAASDLTA